MDPVGPSVHFLNIQYFFRLLYDASLGRPDLSELGMLAANIWLAVTVLGYLLVIVLIGALMHYTTRIYQVRMAEAALYSTTSHEHLDDLTDRSRWQHVLTLIESPHESDWRQAILEADIMLDEILDEQGYTGESVGEKLKQVNPARFATIRDAWDAHMVRNAIAHQGSAYQLTEHIAHRTIAHYENVFREFGEV